MQISCFHRMMIPWCLIIVMVFTAWHDQLCYNSDNWCSGPLFLSPHPLMLIVMLFKSQIVSSCRMCTFKIKKMIGCILLLLYIRWAADWSCRWLEFSCWFWEYLENLEQFSLPFQSRSSEGCSLLCLEWLQLWEYPTSRYTFQTSTHSFTTMYLNPFNY